MKKNHLKIIVNILFVASCLAFLGTLVSTFIVKDILKPYEMGSYITTICTIDIICIIFISIKVKTINYFK